MQYLAENNNPVIPKERWLPQSPDLAQWTYLFGDGRRDGLGKKGSQRRPDTRAQFRLFCLENLLKIRSMNGVINAGG